MANIRKIDPKMLRWDTPNVLYRGIIQYRFEAMIIASFVQGKPLYYGFEVNQNKEKRTYVDEDLTGASLFVEYRLKQGRKPFFGLTNYPLIVGIQADKYLDRLGASDEGEGIFIQGEINADDITILFSSECDKLPERISKLINGYVGWFGLANEKSLFQRYSQNEKDMMPDLESICFGPHIKPTTLEDQQKIRDAMAYLQRKLGSN